MHARYIGDLDGGREARVRSLLESINSDWKKKHWNPVKASESGLYIVMV